MNLAPRQLAHLVRRTPTTSTTTLTALMTAALIASACVRERSDFGRPCVDDSDCREGSLCLERSCVRLREAGEIGESCARPLPVRAPAATTPLTVGSVTTSIGSATLDERVPERCVASIDGDEGGAAQELRDVVVRFDLAEESGVRVRVTADVPLAIAVVPLAGETCDARPGDRCTGADAEAVTPDGRTRELLVPRVAAGSHVVIVTAGASAAAQAVKVSVDLIDCPVGFMPIEASAESAESCIGWREIEALPVAGVGARAVLVPNGLVLAGGNALDAPRAVAAFLDTTTESWSFLELSLPIGSGGVLPLRDGSLLMLGSGAEQTFLAFHSVDAARLRVVADAELQGPFAAPLVALDLIPATVGALILAPNERAAFVTITPRSQPCPSGFCPQPFQCIETQGLNGATRLCTCLVERCGAPPSGYDVAIAVADSVSVPLTEDFSFARLSSERTLISGFADGQARLFDSLSDAFAVRPNLVHRPGAALTGLDASNAAQTGGRDEAGGGAVSGIVEIYDIDNGSSRTFLVPGAARVDHTATLAFGHLVLIGGREGGSGVAAATSSRTTLVDVDTGESIELEDLPEPRVDHVAIALDGNRVVVAGGSRGDDGAAPAARSFILERVRRGRPPPPRPGDAPALVPPEDCDFITDLALDTEPSSANNPVVVTGTTIGRRDEVRAEICPLESEAPDAIFRIRLDEPVHIVIQAESQADRPIWVTRGPCRLEDRADVACGSNDLEILSLDAGEWLIVVEASFNELEEIANGDFTLSVRVVGEGTDVCEPDADDPADDDVTRPRRLEREDSGGDLASTFNATGALCPGDVDHLLVEHPGGLMFLNVSGLEAGNVDVIPASIDEAAAAAAGEAVVVPHLDEAQPLTSVATAELDEGAYIVALRAPALAGATLRAVWDVAANPFCVPDPGDSLFAAFDDANNVAARTTLGGGSIARIAQCFTGDVDVLPLDFTGPNASAGDLVASVNLADVILSLHPLNADGTLGAAVPAQVDGELSTTLRVAEEDVPVSAALRVERGDTGDDFVAVRFQRIGGPGDTCDEPLPLEPDAGALSFSTVVYSDDVDAQLIGDCTGFRTPGRDSFYSVFLATGDTLVVDAVGTAGESPDVALFMISAQSCPPDGPDACLAGVDVGFTLAPEHFEFTNDGPSGTYLLVVDSFFGGAFDVELEWSVTRQ